MVAVMKCIKPAGWSPASGRVACFVNDKHGGLHQVLSSVHIPQGSKYSLCRPCQVPLAFSGHQNRKGTRNISVFLESVCRSGQISLASSSAQVGTFPGQFALPDQPGQQNCGSGVSICEEGGGCAQRASAATCQNGQASVLPPKDSCSASHRADFHAGHIVLCPFTKQAVSQRSSAMQFSWPIAQFVLRLTEAPRHALCRNPHLRR